MTSVTGTLVVQLVDHWKVTLEGVLTHLAEYVTKLIMYVVTINII